MQSLKIKVNAKINLSLDITGVRKDGYHLLDMLMTSVDVYDVIEACKSDEPAVFMDGVKACEDNTALKAVNTLRDKFGVSMRIDIRKGIPFSSGMGGSSADASGVFYCAHKLYSLDIDRLLPLALSIGCDVPYMIFGGAARVQGVGEEISPLAFPVMHLVIAQKCEGASTKEIYKRYDECAGEKGSIDDVLKDIKFRFAPFNVLEKSAISLCPEIEQAKQQLLKFTDTVFMTGSGSAYVGVFSDERKATECCDALEGMIFKTCTVTKDRGITELAHA